jgi:hypothetical protein
MPTRIFNWELTLLATSWAMPSSHVCIPATPFCISEMLVCIWGMASILGQVWFELIHYSLHYHIGLGRKRRIWRQPGVERIHQPGCRC